MADLLTNLAAVAGAAGGENLYIEDVFSTYLYTGNGSTQTIQNGINLGTSYAGPSLEFDGVNDFLSRASDLSGNADGKQVTFSAWIHPKVTGGWTIYSNDSLKFTVYGNAGQLLILGRNSAGTNIVYAENTRPPYDDIFPPGRWHHILISFDLSNASHRYVYLNDSSLSMTWNTYTNADIDFTNSTHYIGDRVSGGYRLQSYLSNVFLDYVYRDISVEANRRLFVTSGLTPATNQQSLSPIMYLPMTTSAGSNLGTGGDFTVNGNPQIDDNFGPYTADSSEGGLVWIKGRSGGTHNLVNTVRGLNKVLRTNANNAEITFEPNGVTAFNSNGFSVGSDATYNGNTDTYASWTFRKAPKFFDVVTYTGTGANRTVSHNLGSVPGCIIVKRTDTTGDWQVYHRANTANPETDYLVLNSTAATADSNTRWNDTQPTDAVFSLGTEATVNASGGTYVAYLWAHDDGGFGDDGLQNVVTCGTFTGNTTVNLGFEPQWILLKNSGGVEDWYIHDNMRGWPVSGDAKVLYPNLSSAEGATAQIFPNATGFTTSIGGGTYIYIAIRRGPMKTPTAGTEVFGLNARTGTGANTTVTGSAGVSDAVLIKNRGSAVASLFAARLTATNYLVTSTTAAQVAAGTTILQANPWDVMDGVKVGTTSTITNASANTFINYLFSRAPGFFDVVCYTGTGANRTVAHNLGVVPELMVIKSRTTGGIREWVVYSKSIAIGQYLYFTSAAVGTNTYWNNTAPTASVFSIDSSTLVNNSPPETYVAYLFATCAGVSKVGSYTGTAAAQTINCGFTSGARFILIKRTDSTGDWYVWDTARGIVSGDDPYWLINSDAAEVTNTDYIDPLASGFEISSTAPAAINASGGTFIFLAIA